MRVEYPSLEERKKLLGFLSIELIDVLREGPHCVYALPSRHGVCSYDWMDRGQVVANILRCTAWTLVYDNVLGVGRGSFQETITNECRCQALEKFAVWLRESARVVS